MPQRDRGCDERSSEGARAAFVLYTEVRTVVVPTDPCEAVHEAAGLWFLAPDGVPRRLADVDAEAESDATTESEIIASSVVGGRLEQLADERSWGARISTHDAQVRVTWLSAPRPPAPVGVLLGCTFELDPASPWPLPELAPASCDASFDEDFEEEAVFHLLRGGDYYTLAVELSTEPAVRVWRRPARPESCEEASDPCGEPAGFPPPQDGQERWIATSGAHALYRRDLDHRVVARGGRVVRRGVLDLGATEDVIGVRHHDDVARLVAAMSSVVSADPAATARDRGASARDR